MFNVLYYNIYKNLRLRLSSSLRSLVFASLKPEASPQAPAFSLSQVGFVRSGYSGMFLQHFACYS